jgi:hypothetical protein
VLLYDVKRYTTVLAYIGLAISTFGLVLIFVDWVEGLPLYWKVWEGPFVVLFGVVMFVLNRRIDTAGG